MCRYCSSVFERRREGHWTSNPVRLLMARRRAHQREVARRGSNSFRPTLASVSAERRGAAEMPLCGRTRGAVEVPGCVCVGSCVAPVREAHLAPSQQASRRRVWALSLCRYCVSVLERRREGHWTSNPVRLLTSSLV